MAISFGFVILSGVMRGTEIILLLIYDDMMMDVRSDIFPICELIKINLQKIYIHIYIHRDDREQRGERESSAHKKYQNKKTADIGKIFPKE